MDYRILPPEDFMEARLAMPLSKSMSARALILAALTPGASLPTDVADCDDTRAIRAALSDPAASDIDVGAGGTTMRFLTAYYAATPGRTVTLRGTERMHSRPIAPLVDALRSLGAEIDYLGAEGFPPLRITGRRLAGGDVVMDGSVSSQFTSALCMIAPAMERGLTLRLTGDIVSASYIRLTLSMMAARGVEGELYRDTVTIPSGTYVIPAPVPMEGDWSAAAAWYEIEALAAGVVTIDNLSETSAQPDRRLADIFSKIGVDTDWEGENGGIDLLANPDPDARVQVDFTENPDLAPYAIVTCAMLGLPFNFTGMQTLAVKECDRLQALRTELVRTGIHISLPAPGVAEWDGRRRPVFAMPEFETYDDHRMAMCLAPVSIFIPGIVVRDAEVVAKSYPSFWDDLRAAGFTLLDPSEKPAGEAADR